MIIIEVTTVNGQLCADPLAAEFDELGGNIGRAQGNTLVLADPEKVISRRHASIAFRSGRYVLSDHGAATPVYVNGRALGNGQESPIDVGDEIRIGGFTLRVKPGAAAAAPAGAGGASAQPIRAAPGESKDDLLQLLGGRGGGGRGGAFDDLIAPAPRAAPATPASRPSHAAPTNPPVADKRTADAKVGDGMAIPPDFDIFEAPAAAPPPKGMGGAVIPDDLDLPGGGPRAPAHRASTSCSISSPVRARTHSRPATRLGSR